MKKYWIGWFWGLLLGAVFFMSCGRHDAAAPRGSLNVTVSILPQKYFVESIGGSRVVVNVMVGPGESPATYEPKPTQLKALSRADAYMCIGVPYEKVWMPRIAAVNKDIVMVDTTRNIKRMSHSSRHGHSVAHPSEGTLDPHIWLSPALVKVQAKTICEALSRLDPDYRIEYRKNLTHFLEAIDALDAEIRHALKFVKTRKFIVFHPSWGYFARDYGLDMIALEVGGQKPSPAELGRLIAQVRVEGIKALFAQPAFSAVAVQTLAEEINGEVIWIDPLALNWKDNLRHVAHTLAKALSE